MIPSGQTEDVARRFKKHMEMGHGDHGWHIFSAVDGVDGVDASHFSTDLTDVEDLCMYRIYQNMLFIHIHIHAHIYTYEYTGCINQFIFRSSME